MEPNRDKFEQRWEQFARILDFNAGWHNEMENFLLAVRGGAGMWDPNARRRLEKERRPYFTDNLLHRNLQIHVGHYLKNAMDFRYDGDNSNLDAPIELANLYHRHIRQTNKLDYEDMKVWFMGSVFMGAFVYDWILNEDGAKDIGCSSFPMLATYRDPHCGSLDIGGPETSVLHFSKWGTPETLAEMFPEAEGELKDQIEYIKKRGYTYETKNEHLRDRYGDFYDQWSGMGRVIECWYYQSEKRDVALDLADPRGTVEAPHVPVQDKNKLNEFMRRPGFSERFYITRTNTKILYKDILVPAFFRDRVHSEEHPVQVKTSDGKNRMPIATFSAYTVGEEPKGLIADALPLNMLKNRLLTSQVHVAISNASNNVHIAPESFIDPKEAEEYIDKRSLGGRTWKHKIEYFIRGMLPKKEEANKMDTEAYALTDRMDNSVRNSMLTPDVVMGEKEKGTSGEPLGSFARRQVQAMTALAPVNANWESTQMVRADIEWSMMRTLGDEGVERVIESGPDSEMFPGTKEIIVNMQRERGGTANDLSKIPRGKVTVVKREFTDTQATELLSVVLDSKELFESPQEQLVLKELIVEGMPIPKAKKDQLLAAIRPAEVQPGAAPGAVPMQDPGAPIPPTPTPGAAPVPPPAPADRMPLYALPQPPAQVMG